MPRNKLPIPDQETDVSQVGAGEAIGQAEVFLDFQERLSRAARIDRPVLLIGERGTGKELAASRLHYLSSRWQGPLLALNCAALNPGLIESELFGHERGAFTGATRRRTGRFEQAGGGTLFLDEIALIPMEVQEKILRVVEYGMIERVGSSRSIEVDARIIGATNTNLLALTEQGRFKRDLLDRLSFEVLFLPPLRERTGDVMLLANHFAARMAHELGWEEVPQFSDPAIAALEKHDWPGNIRELKNVVERAVYRSPSPMIEMIDFDPFRSPYQDKVEQAKEAPREPTDNTAKPGTELPASNLPAIASDQIQSENKGFQEIMREVEAELLRDALQRAKFSQKKAAELLKLSYHQFRWLYRKHGKKPGR